MTSPLLQFTNRCIAKLIGVDEAELAGAVQQYGASLDIREMLKAALARTVQQYEASAIAANHKIAGLDIGIILMLFETLMPMIMEMIANCQANQARVNAIIRSPGLIQRIVFRRHVNQAVRNGERHWRGEAHEIATIMLAEAAQSTEEDVDAVINECRSYQFLGQE